MVCLTTLPASGAVVHTADGPVVVQNYGYQLQGPSSGSGELLPGPLASAAHDLLVIDFARFGTEATKFTPVEITSIQESPVSSGGNDQRKVVTGYVSIGEASEFRSYWNSGWTEDGTANSPLSLTAPSWLGPVDPDWPESRHVRYWDPAWQETIFNGTHTGWLDQVVTQGFDGAYLDIVDGYYLWGTQGQGTPQPGDPADEQEAARRMIDFVVAMTGHARQTNPVFFVIPQNGAFILSDLQYGPNPESGDAARRTAYLDAIGAIGIEDAYHPGDLEENNPFQPDADKIQVLKDDFLSEGKPILVVDYLNQEPAISNFISTARNDGFIPYAAHTRSLEQLDPSAPAILLSDFDADEDVDGADFLRWQRGVGLTSGALPGDGDADGDTDVDHNDLIAWQWEAGPGSLSSMASLSNMTDAATTAVPEPLLGTLLTGVLLCFDLFQQRHHRP